MMKKSPIALVKWYQRRISPMSPPSRRYHSTCSNYMIGAIGRHGLKGILMGIARILRCHPFVTGDDDLVPDYFTLRRNRDFRTKKEEGWDFPLLVT